MFGMFRKGKSRIIAKFQRADFLFVDILERGKSEMLWIFCLWGENLSKPSSEKVG